MPGILGFPFLKKLKRDISLIIEEFDKLRSPVMSFDVQIHREKSAKDFISKNAKKSKSLDVFP